MNTLRAMPAVTDLNSFAQAVDKSMWALESAVVRYSESTGEEFKFNIPAYRWNIEQAMINRQGGTMLEAGLNYVENLSNNFVNMH